MPRSPSPAPTSSTHCPTKPIPSTSPHSSAPASSASAPSASPRSSTATASASSASPVTRNSPFVCFNPGTARSTSSPAASPHRAQAAIAAGAFWTGEEERSSHLSLVDRCHCLRSVRQGRRPRALLPPQRRHRRHQRHPPRPRCPLLRITIALGWAPDLRSVGNMTSHRRP